MSDTVEKNLKLNIDADIEPTLKNLRELKIQLKSAGAGSVEFRKIQEKIDDVEDSLKSAKTSAGSFVDILGTVPGPLGDIGSKASTTIDVLKGFGKLKIGDIKASFLGLAGDIKDAGTGLLKLTGITKVYTVVQEALAGMFIKTGVAEGVAATGASAFAAALTATGIGALVVGLGLAVAALMNYFDNTEEATAAQNAFNASIENTTTVLEDVTTELEANSKVKQALIKKDYATSKDVAEMEAKLFEEQQKLRDGKIQAYKIADKQYAQDAKEQSDKALAALKKNDMEAYDAADENLKKIAKLREEAADKAEVERIGKTEALYNYQAGVAKRELADQEKADAEAAKKKEEAYAAATLANKKKWQKLINDDKIAGRDSTENEIKYQQGIIEVNKKYGKDFFDAQEEARLRRDEADDKAKADRLAYEKEYNDALVNTDIERKDQAIQIEKDKFAKLLENQTLSNEQRIALQTALQENIDKINADFNKKEDIDDKAKLQKKQDYEKSLAQIKEEALRVEYDNIETQRKELSGLDKLFDDDGINAKIEYYEKLAILRDEQFAKERQAIVDLATTSKEEEADKAIKLQEIDKKIASNKKAIGDEITKLEEDRNLLSLEKIQGYLATAQELTNAFSAYLEMQNAERVQKTRESYDAEEEATLLAYKAAIDNEAISADEKVKIKAEYEKEVKDQNYKRALQEYEDAKLGFENNKNVQYAQASIGIIQGGIQAFTSLAGIPVVGPILGGIAAAAVAAAGIMQLASIKKSNYSGKKPLPPVDDSSVGSGSSGSKRAQGGLLTGRKHSEGGIPTAFGELEGGEYVVNRSATESFLPLLEKINGMGQGSGAPNNLSVIGEQNASGPAPIIKTYVVASDMTSQQEANKRLEDIARL